MAHRNDLAERKLVQAFYLRGTLAVFATGTLPSPQHHVTIVRSPTSMPPLQFYLLRQHYGGITLSTETPYTVSQLFSVGNYSKVISVAHAGGNDTIEVEEVQSDLAKTQQQLPYVFPPSAIRSCADASAASGYSASFDLGEALRDAVAALPPTLDQTGTTPDCITVIEIGAEIGGIAGFDHLFVRVRRANGGRGVDVSPREPQSTPSSAEGPRLAPSSK